MIFNNVDNQDDLMELPLHRFVVAQCMDKVVRNESRSALAEKAVDKIKHF